MKHKHIELLEALNCCTSPNGEHCVPFKVIQGSLAVVGEHWEIKEIRRVVRHLKRKGMAEFHCGLWTDEGEVAGAGYCISKAGQAWLEQHHKDRRNAA
jgi:hypothetical protein